jgi:hypothetical protein
MRIRSINALAAVLTAMLFAGPVAHADFAAGKRAFDAWNMKEAAAEFERAVRAGDARAARQLSHMYFMGYIGPIKESRDKSMYYLGRAAELGDMEAKGMYGAALLRPVGGVRGSDGTWQLDVEKGLTLLEASCESLHSAPCFHLAELHAGEQYSYTQVPGLPTPNMDRSRKWADLYRQAVLLAAGKGSTNAMLSVAYRQRSFWWLPTFEPEQRAMFGVLQLFATGRPVTKRDYLSDITDEVFAKSVLAAETWEIQRGIRPAVFEPSHVMASRIAKAIGWTDRVSDDDIERIALSYASQISGPGDSGSSAGGFGQSARKLAKELRPIVQRYFEQRNAILDRDAMDAQRWLTRALSETVSPRQLFLLDRFYASQTGRKLLVFERDLITVRTNAGIVLNLLQNDPGAARYGADYSSRMQGYRKEKGIMAIDQTQDGAEKRFAFLMDYYGAARVVLNPLLLGANPVFAGQEYERVSRMLTPDEMDEVTEFRTAYLESGADRVLRQLQTARAAHAELAELDKKTMLEVWKVVYRDLR